MPMDGFTLSFIVSELRDRLIGARVDKVNQPERDALLLLLRSNENYRLLLSANCNQARIQITSQTYENPTEPPMFCMLMRKHLMGARLVNLEQLGGDRVAVLTFDCLNEMGDHVQKTMWLEMMGRYSNLTLTDENGTIIDSIRHVNGDMSRVRMLLPGIRYQLPPAQNKLVWQQSNAEEYAQRFIGLTMPLSKALQEHVSGVAGISSREICAQIGIPHDTPVSELDCEDLSQKLSSFLLNVQANPVLQKDDAGMATDYFPFPYLTFEQKLQKSYSSLCETMDAYYLGRDLQLRIKQRSIGLQHQIKSAIERTAKKQSIMLDTLAHSKETEQYQLYGNLLTASLHLLPKTAETVRVQNYYEEDAPWIDIALSNRITVSQNAQQYFKKYRKGKLAESYASEQLSVLEGQLELLEGTLQDLDNCQTNADVSEIRQILAENGLIRPEVRKGGKVKRPPEGKPYRFYAEDGTLIEVGKNAIQNDRLTLHAKGSETWLHVQGITGSHVIIHTELEPSEQTLLKAAKLAAYFSKGRNRPQQPVDYTLRKYVKKGAGAPSGLVTYTHFQTLYITLDATDCVAILQESAKS